ncbi:MAG: hypothetical protein U0989_06105 [Azonexus sp.]|nr:hypothetical protein [Azonexus sp.]MDZ4314324.1 hypothetical protein [Azonexus sp.]
MTKQHDLPKLYSDLGELSGRWGLPIRVLLAHASAGRLVVYLPHFGYQQKPVTGGENAVPEDEMSVEEIDPVWAVRLDSEALSCVAAYGEASIESGYRCEVTGKTVVTFDVPRRVAPTDLVVAAEEVSRHEVSGTVVATISETKEAALLKQMALLAMLIAHKCSGYKWGDKCNAKKIADDTDSLLRNIAIEAPDSAIALAVSDRPKGSTW